MESIDIKISKEISNKLPPNLSYLSQVDVDISGKNIEYYFFFVNSYQAESPCIPLYKPISKIF